jgi:TonB family protein
VSKVALFFAACLASTFFSGPALAQKHDIDALVEPLAKNVPHSHKRTVVLPLLSADSDARLGVLLAEEISASLAQKVSGVQTVDASSVTLPIRSVGNPPHPEYDPIAINRFAKDVGADLLITGNFASYEDGLGVSLVLFQRDHKELLGMSAVKLELTAEMNRLPPPSILPGASPDAVYPAGWGGVGLPRCLKCPDPRFPRGESAHAVVVLTAVVGTDGLPRDMEVQQTVKASYSEAALVAVKSWKFGPAKGPDGKPVAVRVPIEITFR